MDESGEKALEYTQFWCPRKTFTMLPMGDKWVVKLNQV